MLNGEPRTLTQAFVWSGEHALALESGYLRGCLGFSDSGIEAGAEPLAEPGIRRLFDISRFLATAECVATVALGANAAKRSKGPLATKEDTATITAVPATV